VSRSPPTSSWPRPVAALACSTTVYRVTADEKFQLQIDALPPEALAPFAEARAVVEIAPWNGDLLNDDNPDAPGRTLAFGPAHRGLVT
jgi:hypothetical protein